MYIQRGQVPLNYIEHVSGSDSDTLWLY